MCITVNSTTSWGESVLGRGFSTHGLGDIVCNTVRAHTESFCAGKCALKNATHRLQGVGKARMIRLRDSEDRCPHCWASVFWSNKYQALRVTGDNE